MSTYKDLVAKQQGYVKIDKEQLGGWESVAAAYRAMAPDLTYHAFLARLRNGKSAVEAATMTRSTRGRPRKVQP